MRFLITGASGFIGKNLIEKLHGKHYLRALVRKKSNPKDIDFLKKNKVDIHYGDLLDPPTLTGLADNIDVVIHLAGRLGGYISQNELKKIHIEGTKNLLSVCKTQKFIYCSSAGVLGPVEGGNEESTPRPTNAYEKAKLEAENLVRSYPKHVILRPEFVYGPHDKHVLKLFRAIKEQKFYKIGNGQSMMHPTYVGDLVSSIEAVTNKSLVNDTFLIAGERPVAVKELYFLVASQLGLSPKNVFIPKIIARLYSTTIAKVLESMGINPILTKSRYDFFTKSRTFSSKRAISTLDYEPIKLEEGLKRTINWYKKEGLL